MWVSMFFGVVETTSPSARGSLRGTEWERLSDVVSSVLAQSKCAQENRANFKAAGSSPMGADADRGEVGRSLA